MERRMVAVFSCLMVMFCVVSASLALLSSNRVYAQAGESQTAFRVLLDEGRGNIFDCHFEPLTGTTTKTYAFLEPVAQTYYDMFEAIELSNRSTLYTEIQKSKPFLLPVLSKDSLPEYIQLVEKQQRYQPIATAPHLVGYLNAQGQGVSGMENAANALLNGGSTARYLSGKVSAQGIFMSQAMPSIESISGTGNGIMLTLDATLQRICEGVAQNAMEQGGIVVIESATGKVRASVSMPTFDPSNVSQSFSNENSALMNRVINSYNVGSVFKPLLAAAALENGFDPEEIYECEGYTEINGHVYRCAYNKGHGEINLRMALEQSCNCYFIQLGLALGGHTIVDYAQKTGFGQSTQIYKSWRTTAGNLPTAQTLQNLGQLAGISFGQGALTASPLQVAAFFNIFANNGVYISPSFVEGEVNEYTKTVTNSLYAPFQRQVLLPETAETMREMLVSVVENGLGQSAKPTNGTAGGKTGTAQTGRYAEDGTEILDAWFVGFYPAENPQYTIAILLDSDNNSSEAACEIFSQIATSLHYFCK